MPSVTSLICPPRGAFPHIILSSVRARGVRSVPVLIGKQDHRVILDNKSEGERRDGRDQHGVRSWLRKRLEETDPDLLREMVSSFVYMLMSAEVDALCWASYGERSEMRINRRNGYREREFDTRVGTMPLAIPKLRQGSYPSAGSETCVHHRTFRQQQFWQPSQLAEYPYRYWRHAGE